MAAGNVVALPPFSGRREARGAELVVVNPGEVFAATAAAIEASTAASVAALASAAAIANRAEANAGAGAGASVVYSSRSSSGVLVESAASRPASEVKASGEWDWEAVTYVDGQEMDTDAETVVDLPEAKDDEDQGEDEGEEKAEAWKQGSEEETAGGEQQGAKEAKRTGKETGNRLSSGGGGGGGGGWLSSCLDSNPRRSSQAPAKTSNRTDSNNESGLSQEKSRTPICPHNIKRENCGGSESKQKQEGGEGKWRVSAGKYEEVTWKYGGLYEAFQALTDPRRVVFSMGVVDDGPHHEAGDEGEDGDDARPVVVEGLLGLSVQQVQNI